MKPLLLLFCYLLFISNSLVIGQNTGGCTIDGIVNTDYGSAYVLQIKDTDIDTNLLTAPYQGSLTVTSCTGDTHSYFNVRADDKNFLIDTTKNFADFDKNTDKTTGPLALVTIICTLTCTGDSNLVIQFQVTDTNNHKPEFSSSSYEFKVPIPLMPRTDISVYGETVIATDIDFSNQNVVYTIEPDDFSITTLGTATSKDYRAVFSTRNIIQLTETKTYIITATDSGNPTQSNTATITITIDENLSLDTPSFLDTSYSFNYSVVDNAPVLTANQDSITVSTIKPNVLEVSLSGDFSDYFKLTFDASSRTIDFDMTDLLPTTEAPFLILTLGISSDNTASTSVIVNLPQETKAPQFSNHFYTGVYDDVNEKVTHDVIQVVSTTTPEVTIVGDYADYFSIVYDKESDSYKISVSKTLTAEEIKGLSEITVLIQASNDDYYDVAAIVLTLPQHILQFTDVLYKATYKTDNTISIENPIGFTTDVTGISFVVDDTYSKTFGIDQVPETNQYTISVLEPLAGDVLKKEREILLHVTASDKYNNEAQTVVAIQLPETVVDAPTFSEIVYVAKYESAGDEFNIAAEKDIVITNRNQSQVKVTMDLYSDNFDISLSDNKWVLKVIKPLDENTLTSKREILITLTASEENSEATGKAVLVINWTVREALQFSQEYYKGVYPDGGKGSIELDNAIDFINAENPEKVVVNLNSYADNFEVNYITDEWVVSIIKALDEATLDKNSELVIVLSATEDGITTEGHSVLVLQLPSNTNRLQFSAAYYIAKYVSGDTPSIELETPIELLNVDPSSTVDITLDNHADNFEIKYEDDQWIIKIKKILEEDILDKNTELVMTLISKVEENEYEAESVLVLKLPMVIEEITPTFSEAYYVVDYPESGSGDIEFQTKLTISNVDDQSNVTISLDNYEENFEIKYSTERWYFHIKKALEDSELQKNPEIVLTLTAKVSGNQNSGKSALVIQLPVISNDLSPIFTDTYYTANYVEDDKGIIEFENAIDFANIADATSVTITLDKYTENLEVKYDNSRWYIHVIANLDESTKKENKELLITLTAITPEYKDEGYSVLILKVPSDADKAGLKFSEAYYLAQYPEEGSGSIDFETPLKFFNVNNESAVKISLDNYTDNFEVVQDKNKWYLNIKSALDKSILETESELIMTMAATEEKSHPAYSALVIQLPTVDAETGPEFLEAYYLVKYPESNTDTIELPISFEGGIDPTLVTITLDNYEENFEVKYGTDGWYVNIKEALEDSELHKNPEIVITLNAKVSGNQNSGKSALVIQLPVISNDLSPIFTDTYYTANYVEDDKGIIEFENAIDFANIADATSVTITLDKYTENLEVKYDNSRWYIHVIAKLDESTKKENKELLIKLTATTPEYKDEGYSVLVLKLPSDEDKAGLKFSEAYYLAQYPEEGSGSIDFESPLKFLNVNDESALKISLDKYTDNFEVVQDKDKKWYLNIKSALDKSILETESELLVTMIATEGKSDPAYSALVIQLPTVDAGTGPKFLEAYYLVKYPESGTDSIELPISFQGGIDPTSITITLDSYSDNFEVKYKSDKWYVNIKSRLDEEVLSKNAELVMTLTATDKKSNKGYSALVLELPQTTTDDSIRFEKAYYVGIYPVNDDKTISLDISFPNADPKTITIGLDNYSENFEITYTSNKWILNIKKAIDEETIGKNKELLMTMTATDSNTESKAYSALVIQLPDTAETSPIFSEPYYVADYPEEYTGVINLETPISFKNTEDTKVSIKLNDFADNFQVILDNEAWVIKVKQNLDESILKKGIDLVISLIATDSDMNGEGYSALVVRLPKNDLEPIFSAAFYSAKYVTTGSEATISFTDPIDIINREEITDISLTLDNYNEYFEIQPDEESKSWTMKVTKQLGDEVLLAKTDLVISLTATNLKNDLTDRAAIDLILPHLNSDKAPKFDKIYYTARYSVSGDSATVKFDSPLVISNKENMTAISIGTDNYISNFNVIYDEKTESWQMIVINNVDQALLNAKVDLVMSLTATEENNDEVGQAALVMRLPVVNTNDAPKFSSIYYYGTYTLGDGATVSLEDTIAIINKDLTSTTVTISFDDSYKNNFEIVYSKDTEQWLLKIKSPLSEEDFKKNPDLILTLTATEDKNNNIGQAALVLHLPVEETKLPPKFSLSHYTATYVIENTKASLTINEPITVVNKDLSSVSLTLDNYTSNFGIKLDVSKKQWDISVVNPLLDDVVTSTSELVLTLTAKETDNTNEGESTLIIKLPSTDLNNPTIEFSKVHYSATYTSEGKGSITMDDGDTIKLITEEDLEDMSVTILREDYANYFNISLEGDSYVLSVTNPIPSDILQKETNLVLTLVAAVGDDESLAILIINLPTLQESTILFSEALYSGVYKWIDGKGSFSVNGVIEVETDEEDSVIVANISSDTGYESYFHITYANKIVTVKADEIPTDVLNKIAFIPLILTLRIDSTEVQSSAVLNVEIEYQENETSIEFSNVLYGGKYEVTSGDPILTITDTIKVVTDETDVTVNITNEYANYFSVGYSNHEVTITIENPLTAEILSNMAFIPLTLQATVTGTSYTSLAVLNIEIKYENEDTDSVQFSSILYNGQYSVDNGNGKLDVSDTINIVTTRPDDIEARISNDSEYRDFFNISYADKTVKVTLKDDLPIEVLQNNSFITLTLIVGIKETAHTSSAVLNIIIDYDQQERSLSFSNLLYAGSYQVVNGNSVLKIDDAIAIDTDEPDNNVNVHIINEFADFFNVTYTEKKVTISLAKPLTDSILHSTSVVPVALEAEITGTSLRSAAVLNIEIIYDGEGDTESIEFASVLYSGEYSVVNGKGDLKIQDAINVITNTENTIEVSVSQEYRDYFAAIYSNKVVTVDLIKNLSSEIVQSNSFIALTLVAGIKDTAHTASAVLNINIQRDDTDDQRPIAFSNVLYNGQYKVTDEGAKFTVEEIGLDTEEPDTNINVVVTNEYADFFKVAYSENKVTIGLDKPFTDTILNSTIVVPVTLQAEITGTSIRSTAVLNIEIIYDSKDDTQSIEFATVLHYGEYSVDNGKGVLKLQDTINIITNTDNTIEVSVSEEYKEYFGATYSGNVVTIELLKNLSTDIVENNSFITLTLVAGIKDTVHTASAVLNIHIQRDDADDQRTIGFSSVLYNGQYNVTDEGAKFTVTDKIGLDTTEPESNIKVVITNEFASYFTVAYSEKVVTITSKTPLSADTLSTFSVIPLTLQAQIAGTSLTASAVLNIEIQYDGDDGTDTIEFTSVLYTGEYSVKDDKGVLKIGDTINIITNRPDSDIEPSISEDSEYRDHFTVAYSTNVLTITLKDNLPAEVQSRAFISLTLVVGIKGTQHTSSAVLNININSDDNVDQRSIAFTSLLYGGKYALTDGGVDLSVDTIKIETDESDSNVDVTITNEYANYFSTKYSQKVVTIAVSKPVPSEVLNSLSVIPLTLQAQIRDTTVFASSVLNINIKYDGDTDTDIIQFTSVLYTGEYSVDEGKGVLEIDDKINVITNRADGDIEAAISNDSPYANYFDISYAKKTVSVKLQKTLPSEVTKSNSFLALTLTVGIQDTAHVSSAVLNIELDNGGSNSDHDEESKTELHHLRIKFAVVVAVLSVLLLACIAGALAYYFLRVRSGNYDNLEEDGSGRVRFGKNSLTRSPSSNKSSALEERRPTGFIFHPIGDDVVDPESPNGTLKDRRKSVAFDDNVEKMQIDSIDDDTDAYSNDKSQVTQV